MAQTVGTEGIIMPSGDPEVKCLNRRLKSPNEHVHVRNHTQTNTLSTFSALFNANQ